MIKRLSLLLVAAALTLTTQAQRSLGDLASAEGVDWLAGSWTAPTDSGDTIQLSFTPDLDQHIALVHYKDGRSESKGIIYVDPASGMPKYCTANSQGGVGTGDWDVEGDKVVLKYKHTTASLETMRMGMKFEKVDAKTMKVSIHELTAGNQLSDTPRWSTNFKRKP
jgi:hypothetical protein